MDCEQTHDRLAAMNDDSLADDEQRALTSHLQACPECRLAAQGVAALQAVRMQPQASPPDELFDRIMHRTTTVSAGRRPVLNRFWMGAGFGGALAASIMMAVMMSGLLPMTPQDTAEPSRLQVSLGVPREFNVAIDLERDLPDATITVVLSGDIEIDGYAGRKELSWTADLQAGVNKLTLPILATSENGGQLLVKVDHNNRQRRFTLKLDQVS